MVKENRAEGNVGRVSVAYRDNLIMKDMSQMTPILLCTCELAWLLAVWGIVGEDLL